MLRYAAVLCLLFVFAVAAAAQVSPHDAVRTGLIHLQASGTPSLGTHPNVGERGGVVSQGTGFFVGTDGFILTTRHFLDPLEAAEARQVTITAAIGDAGSVLIPVQIASELDRVDLLLLKANLPFDMPPPRPLSIGRTSSYDRNAPTALFTSGFHDRTYRRKEAEYNAAESDDFPYAWTLNVRINSGQSGSPVYDSDGTVLGVIKATARTDQELALMIPIEYAMPLIGHMEIDRLNKQVDVLTSIIGEMTQEDPPLHLRLREIEDNLAELSGRFTWSADTSPDGTLRVRYEKLIGGGVQVDGIQINVTPFMRFRESGDVVTRRMRPLRLSSDNSAVFERTDLDENARIGEFEIPGVHAKLETLVEVFDGVSEDQPFRDLELKLIPTVDGQQLETTKLKVVPSDEWN